MKPGALWKVTVALAPEAEEAAMELVQRIFGAVPTAYHDVAKATSSICVYLPKRGKLLPKQIEKLQRDLRQFQSFGLHTGPCRISLTRLRPKDWAEAWKRHFRPFTIRERLLLRPTWSRRRPKSGQAMVELDPGLSFGTGQHPTTRYCLDEIVRLSRPGDPGALLDLGTGSGILAIAAAKLGYHPITALDVDPSSVRVARANAARNHVKPRITIRCGDLTRGQTWGEGRHRVVCANLSDDLLIAYNRLLASYLKPSGLLVLAGILHSRFPEVRKAYEVLGLVLVRSKRSAEWESGTFRRVLGLG